MRLLYLCNGKRPECAEPSSSCSRNCVHTVDRKYALYPKDADEAFRNCGYSANELIVFAQLDRFHYEMQFYDGSCALYRVDNAPKQIADTRSSNLHTSCLSQNLLTS